MHATSFTIHTNSISTIALAQKTLSHIIQGKINLRELTLTHHHW